MSLLFVPFRAAIRECLLMPIDRLCTGLEDHLAQLPDPGGQQPLQECRAVPAAGRTRAI